MEKEIYNIGGIKVELTAPDVDGDGVSGGIEKLELNKVREVIPVQKKTDIESATENLNKDTIDDSRLSTMDFLSRINPAEYEAMTRIDALIALRFFPTSVSYINRSKMRKSVSLSGLGRKEYVDMVIGQQEREVQKKGGVGNFFGVGREK